VQGVSEVAALMLRKDYVTVNTVSEDERPSHEGITQVGARFGGGGRGQLGKKAQYCVVVWLA
jgi:hypothetical protein